MKFHEVHQGLVLVVESNPFPPNLQHSPALTGVFVHHSTFKAHREAKGRNSHLWFQGWANPACVTNQQRRCLRELSYRKAMQTLKPIKPQTSLEFCVGVLGACLPFYRSRASMGCTKAVQQVPALHSAVS